MARSLSEWLFNIVVLIFCAGSVAYPYVIPSASMESTLMTGDHIIVDKMCYSPEGSFSRHILPYEDVQRGDIIVFRYPVDIRQNFVKRVIGIPGDRIRIVNKRVYRNGAPLQEPYAQHIFPERVDYRDDFPSAPPPGLFDLGAVMLANHAENGELIVPKGNYFAMGDNRDNSSDSRYWGFVPRENIVGKPFLILWSYDAPTEDLLEYNWHHVTDLAQHFFTKTRWNRTLHVVRP